MEPHVYRNVQQKTPLFYLREKWASRFGRFTPCKTGGSADSGKSLGVIQHSSFLKPIIASSHS